MLRSGGTRTSLRFIQATADTSTASQDIGTIVSAQANPDGIFEALAVIQTKDAENSQLKLGDAEGPDVTVLDLPYSFENSSEQ